MTPEPRHAPLVPSYGSRTLAELGASILASVGGSGRNVLGLPEVRRVCLLIVDGLGWELLRDHPAAAPFLSELAMNARPLTAGFPATTVTSLTSLGTGVAPGQHGMLGYQVIVPGHNWLLNGLRWDERIDPAQLAAAAHHLRACRRRRHRGLLRGAAGVPPVRADPRGDARRDVPPRRQHGRPGRGDGGRAG